METRKINKSDYDKKKPKEVGVCLAPTSLPLHEDLNGRPHDPFLGGLPNDNCPRTTAQRLSPMGDYRKSVAKSVDFGGGRPRAVVFSRKYFGIGSGFQEP